MKAYVYAVRRADGAIKIGFSRYPTERFRSLGVDDVLGLREFSSVRAAQDEERWLHQKLVYSAIGGEWFRPDESVLDTVGAMGTCVPVEREQLVMVSTRVLPDDAWRLKLLAAERGTTMQKLVIDGLERLLAIMENGGTFPCR